METYQCNCGNRLFFGNGECVKCKRATLHCPQCRQIEPTSLANDGSYRCGNTGCQAMVSLCENASSAIECNRGVDWNDPTTFCEFCRLTRVMPDLAISDNAEKWRKLEIAKQRVLHSLQQIGFPIRSESLPLTFEFKSDSDQPVATGHQNGCITINIREADSVEREKTRLEFAEPQRTLIGHIRHELGHYYWDLIVKPHRIDEFRQLFGDENHPDYATALKHYHAQGPRADWSTDCISPYSTMHPWEDFAETFNAYLDMQSVLATAHHFQFGVAGGNEIQSMVDAYIEIGMLVNELNRDMGLIDLVPEVFNQFVIEKLDFVHSLRNQ